MKADGRRPGLWTPGWIFQSKAALRPEPPASRREPAAEAVALCLGGGNAIAMAVERVLEGVLKKSCA
jgi:hypothetical protein